MRVFYVEDNPADAELLQRKLAEHDPALAVEACPSLGEARARLEADPGAFDLALIDISLPDGSGMDLLKTVRERNWSLAVVILTGSGDEQTAVAALKSGADDYVVKRGDYLERLPLILEDAAARFQAEQERRLRPLRVLYAEPSADDVDLTLLHFARHAPHIQAETAATVAEVLDLLAHPERMPDPPYDALLLDYRLPGMNALDLIKTIRNRYRIDIPAILITGHGNEELAIQALRLGFSDYLVKAPGYLFKLPDALEKAVQGAELNRRQARLQESEARFRRLAENLPDIIYRYEFQPHRGFTYVSPALTTITGYTPEECYADPDFAVNIVHPDDRWMLEENLRDLISTRQPLVMRWIRKDGSTVWGEERSTPVFDADGKLIALEGTLRDVTEQVRQEEAVRQLLERQQHYFATSPTITFALKTDGKTFEPLWVSENITRLLGYSPAEALRPGWWEQNLHPDDRSKALSRIPELFAKDRLVHEYRFLHQDRSVIWVVDQLRLLRDESGAPAEVVGSWTDVTERRQLEAQFRQAQKMEAVGRLAGGVAHDFNNMLSIISGYAELALFHLTESDPLYNDIQEIRKAAKRSADLTRQLLAFARKQTIDPVVLDLNGLIAQSEKMLGRLIGEDITLQVLPAPDLWTLRMDPSQLDQILVNLAVNARDAIRGVGTIEIETANAVLDRAFCEQHPGAVPGEYVRMSFRDTGSGMDPDTLARIFDPFFTTKGEGKGTGLGLSTIYGIVKQNDGFIDVASKPGAGTTFDIYIPRTEAKPAPRAEVATDRPIRGNETILVVEDEEQVLGLCRTMLERHGYQVLTAKNPGEALLFCEKHPGDIHLLITDVVMPSMDGKELKNRVEAMKPGIKVIFMSGYTADLISRRGVLAEGARFIQKPFSPGELARRVREVLDS